MENGTAPPRPRVDVIGLPVAREIGPGDDLAALVGAAIREHARELAEFDVVVVAQKIVSKAEGRRASLEDFPPSERALQLARECRKDPRLVEAVLSEASEVLRVAPNVLIVRHRLGFVMAQAGVDRSNVPGDDAILMLPLDPDASAERLRAGLQAGFGVAPAVVISDSFGRPWRLGTTNVALGCAGLPALWDRRGEKDRDGRTLEVTQVAYADAIAGAAGLVIGEGRESVPCALVRGLRWTARARPASELLRPLHEDLFR
jgi:coenzyme F420-0:L-glutamate ligase/coenzyme F420-1:gamma-L-glutamate ligase